MPLLVDGQRLGGVDRVVRIPVNGLLGLCENSRLVRGQRTDGVYQTIQRCAEVHTPGGSTDGHSQCVGQHKNRQHSRDDHKGLFASEVRHNFCVLS